LATRKTIRDISSFESGQVKKAEAEWNTYRTRFLIKARRLSAPMMFVDALGREHRGQKGDYLMESGDGVRRIVPREFFEDAYVPMEAAGPLRRPPVGVAINLRSEKRRTSSRESLGL
jgi:hypothetical protein